MIARIASVALVFGAALTTLPASAESVETVVALRAGSVLRAVDLRLAANTIPGAISDVDQAVGRELVNSVYPGHVLRSADLRAPTLIERNAMVEMIYTDRTLSLRAEGRALDRGSMGDLIRVMNLASRQTVTGRVVGPQSVEMSR